MFTAPSIVTPMAKHLFRINYFREAAYDISISGIKAVEQLTIYEIQKGFEAVRIAAFRYTVMTEIREQIIRHKDDNK